MKNTVKFQGNDIYFFEVINNKIIINDNYQGVLILNNEFEIIKNIYLMEDLIIDVCFKKESRILLICYEKECIIYLDIENDIKEIMFMEGINNYNFFMLYEWNNYNIILSTYENDFLNLDIKEEKLEFLNSNSREVYRIKREYSKLRELKIYKIFIEIKRAVIEEYDIIKLIKYKEDIKYISSIEKENFHDFECFNDCLIGISENKVSVLSCGNKKDYYPKKGYYFLRGKVINIEKESYLVLLSSSKNDITDTMIERYILRSNECYHSKMQ